MRWYELKTKYRSNPEKSRIIDALELVSKQRNGGLPVSFYIADYNESAIKQILSDLGHVNATTKRRPTDRKHHCVLVHL